MNIIAENGGTVPPADEPAASNLHRRVLSAAVLVPVVLGIAYLGSWPFVALVSLAAVLMLVEWEQLTGRGDLAIAGAQSVLAVVAVALAQYDAAGWTLLALLAAAIAGGGLAAGRGRTPWWPVLGAIWLTVPCLALVWLRLRYPAGFELLLGLLLVVWACDTAAYFVGRAVGGPRLAPRWSPSKTWSGLAGGMVGSAVTAALWAHWTGFADLRLAALAGAVLALVAQLGDISESVVKRRYGVKDSGRLIPGHGGLLDRLDGLLFAAPATLVLLLVGGRGLA